MTASFMNTHAVFMFLEASSSLLDKYRKRIFTVFPCLVYWFTIVSVYNVGFVLKLNLTIFVLLLSTFTFMSILLNVCTVGRVTGKMEI